jgi:hypothetical protein
MKIKFEDLSLVSYYANKFQRLAIEVRTNDNAYGRMSFAQREALARRHDKSHDEALDLARRLRYAFERQTEFPIYPD